MKKKYISGYSYMNINNERIAQKKLLRGTSDKEKEKLEKAAICRIIDKMSIMELRELGFGTSLLGTDDCIEEGTMYARIYDRQVELTLDLDDVVQTVEA